MLASTPPAIAAEPQFLPDIAPSSAFPDPRRATRRDGIFVAPEQLRLITPGMTKRQLYPILGAPHFHEGLFGERRWDYIVNLYTGEGTSYRICRLQLRWGQRMRLDGISWDAEACSAVVYQGATSKGMPIAAAPAIAGDVVAVAPLTIYFAHDSAALAPDARQALDNFAASASGSAGVDVIGYTDSAGPDAHNDRLSLARADAVSEYLGATGMAATRRHVAGAGERGLATSTADNVPEARNRRVVVTIRAQ
ncbi:OmpA family protein [Sphingobium sp. H39-3-25]|uniref:OmpA family protein n=1 Tax=Sphingobium arseniciresistens TaxID=3030834 RepID=UPI0023B892B9|nr:OmpA family protein [Sphingobium arseniciresistens]